MSSRPLVYALLALVVFYLLWFARDAHLLTGLLVFALPPFLLAIATWRGWHRASFVAGVFALLWFSHGVMTAWTDPARAAFAWAEITLSLLVVVAASWPGLRARLGKRRG